MLNKLYASPMSLYSSRVRSYFIKAGINFREIVPTSDHYEDVVLPKAGNRRSMPTVELSDGSVIRDSVAILDHFESKSGFSFAPKSPKHNCLSLLFDVIGAEGMLRPAMHYRWRFKENEPMVRHDFSEITPRNAPYMFTVEGRTERMQQACIDLGVPMDRVELVESLYLRLLKSLENHFALYPYLLGGKPSIGDFGFIAPMHAHLGRDIAPLALMYKYAPNVLRWTERMNRPDPAFSANHEMHEDFLKNDEVPETLIDVLRVLAIDFVPETKAACEFTNHWLQKTIPLARGSQVERGIGAATFEIEGQAITTAVQPFRFYLLKRLQDFVSALPDIDQLAVIDLFSKANMDSILDMQITRSIGRAENLEVWR
jgi:glutathione S-transferase